MYYSIHKYIFCLTLSLSHNIVISSEFVRKQRFKLKKIERPIYVRNVDGTLNKKGLIENIVEVNIYY